MDFDGVVGAEGEGDAVVEERAPGIGVLGALGAEAGGGPVHVGEEMGGLHGGDDALAREAIEVVGEQDLGVFDAEAQSWREWLSGGGVSVTIVGVGAVAGGLWSAGLATCSAASKALRAMSLARSPMAWKPSWKPAAARSAAMLVELRPGRSGGGRSYWGRPRRDRARAAVREPSEPSMKPLSMVRWRSGSFVGWLARRSSRMARGWLKSSHSETRRWSLLVCSSSSRARKSSQSELSWTVVTPWARASSMATSRAWRRCFEARWRDFAEDEVGGGGFAEDAGGGAGGVAVDLGAGGVGGVGGDAGGGEGGGVGDGHVAVDAAEDAGVAGGDGVDVLACGEFLAGPEGVVPAAAVEPGAGLGRWRRRCGCAAASRRGMGRPSRSTESFCWPASAMWVWASLKPGMAKAPWRSMILVFGAFSFRMVASVPTAWILPLAMAMAVTLPGWGRGRWGGGGRR